MSRKSFYPTPTLPLVRGGSKKFTNDCGSDEGVYEGDFWLGRGFQARIASMCCDLAGDRIFSDILE